MQVAQWVELQMAGGQTRRTELNSRKQQVDLENVLIAAGAHNIHPADLSGTQPAEPTTPTPPKE